MHRPSPRTLRTAVLAVGGLGVLLVLAGTFLPWLRSGSQLRDSYQTIGLIRFYRLLDGNPLAIALDVWVGLTPAMTLCVVAFGFGLRRFAAAACGIVALLAGTVATTALVQLGSGSALLGVAGTGPVITLTGSVLVLLGAVGVFTTRRQVTVAPAVPTTGGTP